MKNHHFYQTLDELGDEDEDEGDYSRLERQLERIPESLLEMETETMTERVFHFWYHYDIIHEDRTAHLLRAVLATSEEDALYQITHSRWCPSQVVTNIVYTGERKIFPSFYLT